MQVDTFGEYVRRRLERWGQEFALHRDFEYLGHASKNVLQVLIDHRGFMPPPNVGFKPLEVDAEALQVERIVTDIARDQLHIACCMRAYWCGSGRRKVERLETANMLLANCGRPMVRERAYLTLVEDGFLLVRGALIGKTKEAA